MPPITALTPAEVAEHLRVSERTLETWRARRRGPPWMKVGRGSSSLIRYPRSAFFEWLASQPGTATPDERSGRRPLRSLRVPRAKDPLAELHVASPDQADPPVTG